MRPLPNKFFGPSGLPCVFTIDDDGNTAVGYFLKQLGARRFVATDGTHITIVTLAQTSDAISSLSVMPVGTCTILVTQYGAESAENINQITEYRCSTVQGSTVPWHSDSPTPTLAGITTPNLSGGDDILLETGDFWLLQNGTHWELETFVP